MSTPEKFQSRPIWEGAVVGFLCAVEFGVVARDQIIPSMGQICRELISGEMLTDLGELQRYLRQQEAIVQLVAHPFRKEEMGHQDIDCRDILTEEQRSHWLMVSVGRQEAAAQLQALAMSDEMNETTLANHTGMLVIES